MTYAYQTIIQEPCPNWTVRTCAVKMSVLHVTDAPNVDSTLDWFSRPESQVSAHYVIDKNGQCFQCVYEDKIAWHVAGANQESIGIEFVGLPTDAATDAQAKTGTELLNAICEKYSLALSSIYGHKWVPTITAAKDCPGKLFGQPICAKDEYVDLKRAE